LSPQQFWFVEAIFTKRFVGATKSISLWVLFAVYFFKEPWVLVEVFPILILKRDLNHEQSEQACQNLRQRGKDLRITDVNGP